MATRLDRPAALAFYIALGSAERSYAKVAQEYGVSTVTVAKLGRRENWVEQAKAADEQATKEGVKRAVRSRSERVAATLRFVDDALDKAATRLENETLEIKASDISTLVKTAELLLGEPTDRVQISQLRPMLDAYDTAIERLRSMVGDEAEADKVVAMLDEDLLAVAARSRQTVE